MRKYKIVQLQITYQKPIRKKIKKQTLQLKDDFLEKMPQNQIKSHPIKTISSQLFPYI